MRMPLTGFTLFFAVALCNGPCAQAQPYCAMYSDGERNCGIPTWQSCQQSISGVGGFCVPDTTAVQQPTPMDGRFARPFTPGAAAPGQGDPQDPNWMPPPPDE
jgi:hypothetical protein